MSLYQYPRYYDIAFRYRDVELECDFIEKKMGVFGSFENPRFLDVACGTGAHLIPLSRRGYAVDGFDLAPNMVEYAREKADEADLSPDIWVDNMVRFRSEQKYGMAINLLTGFNYLLYNEDAVSHLKCVGSVMDSGGIYIIELNHPRDFITNQPSTANSWVETDEDVEVEVVWDYNRSPINVITHQVVSNPQISVKDGDQDLSIDMHDRYRIYLYQEMRLIIACSQCFELVDACGSFKLDNPLDDSKDSWRMILVLRRL